MSPTQEWTGKPICLTTKETEVKVVPEITESGILSSLKLMFVAALYAHVVFYENVDSLVFGVYSQALCHISGSVGLTSKNCLFNGRQVEAWYLLACCIYFTGWFGPLKIQLQYAAQVCPCDLLTIKAVSN